MDDELSFDFEETLEAPTPAPSRPAVSLAVAQTLQHLTCQAFAAFKFFLYRS
jgi:hypothetical protein